MLNGHLLVLIIHLLVLIIYLLVLTIVNTPLLVPDDVQSGFVVAMEPMHQVDIYG